MRHILNDISRVFRALHRSVEMVVSTMLLVVVYIAVIGPLSLLRRLMRREKPSKGWGRYEEATVSLRQY